MITSLGLYAQCDKTFACPFQYLNFIMSCRHTLDFELDLINNKPIPKGITLQEKLM